MHRRRKAKSAISHNNIYIIYVCDLISIINYNFFILVLKMEKMFINFRLLNVFDI